MSYARSCLAGLLCVFTAAPGFAQSYQITGQRNHGFFNWFANNYTSHSLPTTSFEDSPRIDKLMRAGNIYLSLRDAIALALENNLFRAKAGALLRNVSNSISAGPSSASIGVLASTQLGSGGTGGGASSS